MYFHLFPVRPIQIPLFDFHSLDSLAEKKAELKLLQYRAAFQERHQALVEKAETIGNVDEKIGYLTALHDVLD